VVNLTCAVTAEPYASFVWQRNHKPIAMGSGRIYNDTHSSVLTVDIKDKNDLGDYICTARNFVGEMRRVFNLNEGHRPEKPTMVKRVIFNIPLDI
jgi:hypothetical protein